MMIRTEKQIQLFKDAIRKCAGYVSLVDPRCEKVYDLKCSGDLKEAIGQLMNDYTERLELYISLREDTQTMLALMYDLKNA